MTMMHDHLVPVDRSNDCAHGCRERDHVVKGRRLRVCEWGPPAGPPVLLIHGILDQALVWEPAALLLAAEGYRVVVPDLRGHGLSQHAASEEGYGLTCFAADLATLTERLALDRFVLVGHSLGSLIAVLYASSFPAQVTGLVLVETILFAGCDKLDMREELRQDVEYLRAEHCHSPMVSLDAAVALFQRVRPRLDAVLARRLCERGTRARDGGVEWRWDPVLRTRLGMRFPARRAQYLELLRQISTPVWLLFGRSSRFTRAEETQQLLAAFPMAHGEVADGGHDVHIENPGALLQSVLALQRWESVKTGPEHEVDPLGAQEVSRGP